MAIKKIKVHEKAYSLGNGNGLSLIVEPNGFKEVCYRYQFNGNRILSGAEYE